MSDRRKLNFEDDNNFGSFSREQPTMSQIGLEGKQNGSRLGQQSLLHLYE